MTQAFHQEYCRKLISAGDAAALVKSGDCIHLGGGANIATVIDSHLARRKTELEDVAVYTFTDTASYEICSCDPEGKVFHWYSGFVLPYTRALAAKRGIGIYSPATWHCVPEQVRKHFRLDVFFLVTAPMDEDGYFNYGLMVGHMMAMTEVAARIVVVVREDMPWIFNGSKPGIHISEVDHIVEDTATKTWCSPEVEVCENDRLIAKNILAAGLIKDGSTLQVGIGGLPNSVLDEIRNSGIKNCGLHTELLTGKVADLIKAGVVTNSEKRLDRYKTVFTFCLGDRELYDYIDRNPAFLSYPVEYTNHPMIISQQPQMLSLNGAAQIDLSGQVGSEQMGGARPVLVSGTGGQLDFVMGTMLSQDQKGCSVLALYSEYKDRSKIVPLLEQGTNVTVPRSLVDHVATEWGVVRMRDLTVNERALALIAIAHPSHRDRLAREAGDTGLIPYGATTGSRPPKGVLVRRD